MPSLQLGILCVYRFLRQGVPESVFRVCCYCSDRLVSVYVRYSGVRGDSRMKKHVGVYSVYEAHPII